MRVPSFFSLRYHSGRSVPRGEAAKYLRQFVGMVRGNQDRDIPAQDLLGW